jgi:hypothetical protein
MWRTSEKPGMCCNIAGIFQCSPIRIRADPKPDPVLIFAYVGFKMPKNQVFPEFFCLLFTAKTFMSVGLPACAIWPLLSAAWPGFWADWPTGPLI